MQPRHTLSRLVLVMTWLLPLIGCEATPYASVTGTVTYQGQPVPMGEVRFTPDSNQGNHGPAVVARIVDGQYQTPKSKGVIGGPYQIRIMGFERAAPSNDPTASDVGPPLFETQHQSAELPQEDCVHHIKIE